MKKFFVILMLAALFSFNNASAQKRKVQHHKRVVKRHIVKKTILKPLAAQPYSQNMLLCFTQYGMPSWYLSVVGGFRYPVDMIQPANYKLVSIDQELLKNYLRSIPYDSSAKKIMLPLYTDENMSCKEYIITRVETMDSALQAKYPELMSFKAVDQYNPLNTARIDCDASSVKIMITHEGEKLFVTPVEYGHRTYYACYSLDDPNFVKQPFEQ